MRSTRLNQEWASGVGLDTVVFGTLTFDGKTDLTAYMAWVTLRSKIQLWREKVLRYFGSHTQLIISVEKHQNHPYPHVHFLIFHNKNVRQIPHWRLCLFQWNRQERLCCFGTFGRMLRLLQSRIRISYRRNRASHRPSFGRTPVYAGGPCVQWSLVFR